MRRDSALVPLSHDHHHGLVAARRARRAVTGEQSAAAAGELAGYVEDAGAAHFREEEELLLPLLACFHDAAPLPARIVTGHAALRAAAARLRLGLAAEGELAEAGRMLEEHIRLEERELFPLIERVVPAEALAALELPARVARGETRTVDLLAAGTHAWSAASEDLNATLVDWPPGGGVAAHRNQERDVLYVVVTGSGTLTVDGDPVELAAGRAVLVAKGAERAATAGPDGLRYLTTHLRRSGLVPLRRRS